MKQWRFLCPFLFAWSMLPAQYDSLLNKSFIEKRQFLFDFYQNILKIHDPVFQGKEAIIEGLKSFGEQHKDQSLVAEAALATAWLQALQSPDGKLNTHGMLNFIVKRQIERDHISVSRAYRMLGDLYWQKDANYELAFDCYFNNIETGKLLSQDEYPEKMADYATIGAAYYFFKDYEKAVSYLKAGLTFKPPNDKAPVQCAIRNTIGLCYQKSGNLDSSDYYFNQILLLNTNRREEWQGIAMGNLGYNEYLKGNFEKAIPLLKQDIAIAARYNNPEYAAKSFIWLAHIYLTQNDISKAGEMTNQAKYFIEGKKRYDDYLFLFPLMSRLNAVNGNRLLSQQYLDSSLWVNDSINKKFNAMQLARAQQKIVTLHHKQEIAELEKEKKNKILQRNILIGFLLLLTFVSLYIYSLIRKRHRQEQIIRDLLLEKKQIELSVAEKQLEEFALRFQNNSKLLEEMEKQWESKGNETERLLTQLHESTLLTEAQWIGFRQTFEKVHNGYLVRLKLKLPDLTPAEIRYMTLAKLQFSTKEMAAALGISQQTVRVIAHRLRKKLHLPEEGSLSELVDSI